MKDIKLHISKMLKIVANKRSFYKDMDGDVADIAQAVCDILLYIHAKDESAESEGE